MKTLGQLVRLFYSLSMAVLLTLTGFGVQDALGTTLLGSVDGVIGGGQFTTSAQVPNGIYFGYGYGGIDASAGRYVFDDIVLSGADEITLFAVDDPEFSAIAMALTHGVPDGDAFYAGIGFSPAPPFFRLGSFWNVSQIPVPENSMIDSLVLQIDSFSINSTPATGGETLWEVYPVSYRISAHGTVVPIPEPSTCILLGAGLAGFAALGIRRRRN